MDPTDEELNAWILTRLALIGVDLSVLPVDDDDAPADRNGILSSVRSFLRNSVPEISNFEIDTQEYPPIMYPAEWSAWSEEGVR